MMLGLVPMTLQYIDLSEYITHQGDKKLQALNTMSHLLLKKALNEARLDMPRVHH
jgi:hypothetical protein